MCWIHGFLAKGSLEGFCMLLLVPRWRVFVFRGFRDFGLGKKASFGVFLQGL